MKLTYACSLLLIFSAMQLSAQEAGHNTPKAHHHDHNEHKSHKNELALAHSLAFFPNEKETAYGLHLHYVRSIANSKFGTGLGYERIFDDHGHNTVGLIFSYRPVYELSFNVTPAVVFEDKDPKLRAAMHLETAYEFILGPVHLGPIVDFGWDKEDYHYSIGLHLGIGF